MIAIPAVDLRGGACVQLVGGSYEAERVRLGDPVGVARSWEQYGFAHLHVVDLDAATGRGSNLELVRTILAQTELDVQVGGGVRDGDAIERLLADGAQRVVVGTKAIEDQDWLDEITHRFPGEVMVATDVRQRRVVTHGWERTHARNVIDVLEDLNAFPLAGVLVTAVHREGQMQGTDLALMEDAVEASRFPVYASGGVSNVNDLRALAARGVAATVIGMALYTGALDARQVAEEFAE
jgi:phosphoribosylformimino-5-aminoimidazole carboxamide ribotide isomerase